MEYREGSHQVYNIQYQSLYMDDEISLQGIWKENGQETVRGGLTRMCGQGNDDGESQ